MKRRRRGVAILRGMARIFHLMPLVIIMLAIGVFTAHALVNTYEVIAHRDVRYSDVLIDVQLTSDEQVNQQLIQSLGTTYRVGSFGIPKKMKLPEADRHINITSAQYDNGWEASKGQAHTFLTADARQRVFGQAVIYLRTNTATTRHLGEVLHGDTINIVTTEGWQLGYRVRQLAHDPAELLTNSDAKDSEIVVIMIDDKTKETTSFRATLAKVGERI